MCVECLSISVSHFFVDSSLRIWWNYFTAELNIACAAQLRWKRNGFTQIICLKRTVVKNITFGMKDSRVKKMHEGNRKKWSPPFLQQHSLRKSNEIIKVVDRYYWMLLHKTLLCAVFMVDLGVHFFFNLQSWPFHVSSFRYFFPYILRRKKSVLFIGEDRNNVIWVACVCLCVYIIFLLNRLTLFVVIHSLRT